jgi:hypothetical protein
MRQLTAFVIAVAILTAAGFPWNAEAATGLQKAFISGVAANKAPIQNVTCWPRKIDSCPWHKKRRHGRCVPCTY